MNIFFWGGGKEGRRTQIIFPKLVFIPSPPILLSAQLGPRFILTVIQLSKMGSSSVSTDLMNVFFEVVVRSGVTRLRNTTRLEALLSYEEERDPKKKQKYESIVEEMRSVSVH